MDLQHVIDLVFGIVLTALLGFGRWIVTQINNRPTKAEVRELFDDKLVAYTIYVQELKEDIRRLEAKLDKLSDSLDKHN